jgi:mono/diheme cytochrome c family protein
VRRARPVNETRTIATWVAGALLMAPPAPWAGLTSASAQAPSGLPGADAEAAPAGVENPRRAWQNWTLNCQGCHRLDGTGSEGTAPSLAGTVAKFLWVPGGREYLIRVPGVATSPLANDELAEVVNWMLWRFDKEHLPSTFQPFTGAEMGRLRSQPLRLEASQMRNNLLSKAESSGPPR